jgi:hypothetical protein
MIPNAIPETPFPGPLIYNYERCYNFTHLTVVKFTFILMA